jgi:hypothetical protein
MHCSNKTENCVTYASYGNKSPNLGAIDDSTYDKVIVFSNMYSGEGSDRSTIMLDETYIHSFI